MARRVAEAAEGAGAEVRLRHVGDPRPESFAQTRRGRRITKRPKICRWPLATTSSSGRRRDLRVANQIGSPTSQLRTFIDSLGGLWTQGKLAAQGLRGLHVPRRPRMEVRRR